MIHHCRNDECPDYVRTGVRQEFSWKVSLCSSCGDTLVSGPYPKEPDRTPARVGHATDPFAPLYGATITEITHDPECEGVDSDDGDSSTQRTETDANDDTEEDSSTFESPMKKAVFFINDMWTIGTLVLFLVLSAVAYFYG